jgi:hypothetical protein
MISLFLRERASEIGGPLMAALAVALVLGACSNRSQGLEQRPGADPNKPDRYWTTRLKPGTDANASSGRTYYASPTGSDDNPGDSSRPWRTLQRASAAMGPGDTLLIADGEYPAGLKQRVSGEPGKPITFRAVNPGKAIIKGDEQGPIYNNRGRLAPAGAQPQPLRDALFITMANHVVVDGLFVHNAPRAGIRVDQSNNVTVRRCRFAENGTWGIFTDYSDDLLLEYNECAFSKTQHGISVSNSGDRPIIRFNTCHDNGRAGIQLNGDSKQRKPQFGKRGDGIIEGATLEGNVIYRNGEQGGAAINLACVHDSTISNNLIFDNRAGGIALFNDHRRDMVDFGSKRNRILHNTVVFRTGEGRACVSIKHGSTDNLIRNNILAAGRLAVYEFDDVSSFTADSNVLWGASGAAIGSNEDTGAAKNAAQWRQSTGNDQHSSYGDPKLDKEYRPLAGSPAMGRATEEASVRADVDGKPRPRSGRTIGALEVARKER